MRVWILPLLSLLLFWLALPQANVWAEPYAELLVPAIFMLAAVVVTLSQVFNLGRIGLTALLVALVFALVQWQLQRPLLNDTTYWWYFWLTLLLPLNFAALRFFPEFRPLSVAGVMALAVPLTQIAAVIISWRLLGQLPELIGQFRSQTGGGVLPLPAWVSSGLAVAILLTRLPRRPDVAVTLALLCALHAWLFFAFATPYASLLCALLSLISLMVVLLVSNHQLAFIDELTGLPGRRALMNDLRHRRGQFVLVMADIDHFKKFNDTHGHDVGDDVLRLVASQLAKTQGGGRAYRYGGEEFTLLFPAHELNEIRPFIEAIRERIATYPLVVRNKAQRPASPHEGRKKRGQSNKGQVLHVTMSFGAARRQKGEASDALFKRADKALYKAKQNGRNRVEDAH
ncbi:diguanylate cyclase [Thalassolituus sp. LLYu03]|uniref:GGDEF domain-containing protein n=1 Tax=Thalassolituus sp. LLYu03 TaxID=3421656 RepID=UPI003D27EFAE